MDSLRERARYEPLRKECVALLCHYNKTSVVSLKRGNKENV